jgi:hypothetical protein
MSRAPVLDKLGFDENFTNLAELLCNIQMWSFSLERVLFLFTYWRSIRPDPGNPERTQSKLKFTYDEFRMFFDLPYNPPTDRKTHERIYNMAMDMVAMELTDPEWYKKSVQTTNYFDWFVNIPSQDFTVTSNYFIFKSNEDTERMLLRYQEEMIKYQYWIPAVWLRSPEEIWLYMALKMNLNVGEWIIAFEDLQDYLLIYKDLNLKALENHFLRLAVSNFNKFSDITFNYQLYGEKHRNNALNQVRFEIRQNPQFYDSLELEKLDNIGSVCDDYNTPLIKYATRGSNFYEAKVALIYFQNELHRRVMKDLQEEEQDPTS